MWVIVIVQVAGIWRRRNSDGLLNEFWLLSPTNHYCWSLNLLHHVMRERSLSLVANWDKWEITVTDTTTVSFVLILGCLLPPPMILVSHSCSAPYLSTHCIAKILPSTTNDMTLTTTLRLDSTFDYLAQRQRQYAINPNKLTKVYITRLTSRHRLNHYSHKHNVHCKSHSRAREIISKRSPIGPTTDYLFWRLDLTKATKNCILYFTFWMILQFITTSLQCLNTEKAFCSQQFSLYSTEFTSYGQIKR